MKLCLLRSLAILCSLVGTPTAQDESLKVFTSVWAGEHKTLNETNRIDTICIYYRDLPLLDPCDSISLIMEEFHKGMRQRISYLLLTIENDEFHITPRNFTDDWLERNPERLSQHRLNTIKPSEVAVEKPACTRKFKKKPCPPYMGSYPG